MSADQKNRGLGWDRAINTCAGFVFAALGALVILGAQQFESSGSVTPIFIGISLIVLSLVLIVTGLIAPRTVPKIETPSGSFIRRGVGIVVIIGWVALLPYLGFLLVSIPAFMAISLTVPIAQPWTPRGVIWHTIIATAITTAFWFILTNYLGIALPEMRLAPFN